MTVKMSKVFQKYNSSQKEERCNVWKKYLESYIILDSMA